MQTITIHILDYTGRQDEHLLTEDVTFNELPSNGDFINMNTPKDGSHIYKIIKTYQPDAVEEPSLVPRKLVWYAESVKEVNSRKEASL